MGTALAIAAPASIALGGYAAVFVEGRYVAPFLALLIVAACAVLRPSLAPPRRVALAAVLGAVLWAALDIRIPGTMELALGLLLYLALVERGAAANSLATIAGALMVAIGGSHCLFRAAGEVAQLAAREVMVDGALDVRAVLKAERFPEGRRIAVIGDGPTCAVWAREVRASIVAELPASQAAAFWAASDSVRTAVAHTMRAAGAREIIASGVLPAVLPPGWHRLPEAGVARYALAEP